MSKGLSRRLPRAHDENVLLLAARCEGVRIMATGSTETPSSGKGSRPAPGAPRLTRASAVWVATGAALLLLILLIVFMLQNSTKVEVHFLGLTGTIPLGLALLIAAVGGGVVVAIAGVARVDPTSHERPPDQARHHSRLTTFLRLDQVAVVTVRVAGNVFAGRAWHRREVAPTRRADGFSGALGLP